MPSPTTKLAGQHISLSPLAFWKLFLWAVSFRTPMPVSEVMVLKHHLAKPDIMFVPDAASQWSMILLLFVLAAVSI